MRIYLLMEKTFMPKHILVTGTNGQLGQEFQSLVAHHDRLDDVDKFYFTNSSTLDITNEEALKSFVIQNDIDTIINCAAYTAVDKAEEDAKMAEKVNAVAVKNMAELAKEKHLKLMHVSTDYVFDGTSQTPLEENNATNPQGIYGETKLAGEKAILDVNPEGAVIIRTSWIYSTTGHNFVKTMLRVGAEREEINVVCDQIGTPTYARDLARTILTMFENNHESSGVSIYHYSNEGNCSWYDFAQAIFEIAQIDCKVNPISTSDYPTPAKRPLYSVLNKDKIKEDYGIKIPYWRDSLKTCLAILDE